MKKIYLVRHCSAEGQHKDSPLTYNGMKQARMLVDFFTDQRIMIDKIVSSPYLRAIESIKPYAETINAEVTVSDHLKERILSDEPIDDWLEVLEQSFLDHSFTLPGGESASDAINRANLVLDDLLSDEMITNAILVSHGNLISLLLSQYDHSFGFEQWKNLRNPDIYLININEEENSIKCLWNNS